MKLFKQRKNIINIFKENLILTFFIVSNFANSILLRSLTSGNFSIRPLFFDLAFCLLLGCLSLFIKKSRRNIYYLVVSFVLIAICVINSIYYNYYSSYVSVSLLATSVFVKDVGDVVTSFALKPQDWIYLWSFIGMIVFMRKKYNDIEKKYRNKGLLISLIILAFGCTLPPYNSWSRLIKMWNRVSVVNSFGVYVYQIDDFIQSLKPTFNNMFGYDTALKNTQEYYQQNQINQSINDYSGIFEGKNVIAIHAESLQAFTLGLSFNGKEVTPNINKLIKKGMYFNNFYAQVGVGTSSDSEFTYATSLLPANNGTVFVNYYNNKFTTMQQLLNDKGYYVFSMHGNVGDFWNRDIMHKNMGYDKFYSKSSFVIDEVYGLGLSDESFFRQVVPMISDIKENIGEPYYGTLITLTNHTPWSSANLYSDYKTTLTVDIDGRSVTRDYLEDTALGKYIKSVNYMDSAIGKFIDNMDSEGLLNNTVIVIYGDHDARLSKSYYDYMYNYDPYTDTILDEDSPNYVDFNEYDYELNRRVPFIIFSKDMEKGVEINTPMGMIDVAPTLGNMLNIYNKYALGKDIMSIDTGENTVVFKDGSYVTDKIYYSAKNGEVYTLTNGIISNKYIEDNAEYASKVLEISDNIITYNLLNELK